MAIQTATNPETGERFALVDNQWTPLQTATNPKTGEQFGLIGNEWVSIGKKAVAPATTPASAPPAAEPRAPQLGQISDEFQAGEQALASSVAPTSTEAPISVLQTQPQAYDETELIRSSRRKYVEQGAQEAERLVEIGRQKEEVKKAKREKLRAGAEAEDYGFTDFAKDTGIDLTKGAVGLGQSVVGLYDLTTSGAAGRVLSRAGYDPEETNKFLNGFQSLTRQNARASVEEAAGFINTLKALAVNPTELLGGIAESLPGTVAAGAVGGKLVRLIAQRATVEATAMGLTGNAAKEFIRGKVQEQIPKIALAAGATEGAQATGSIAEQARQQGRDWSDYVEPAIAAGLGTAAISMLSGKAAKKLGIGDIETSIAAKSAGISGVGVGKGAAIPSIIKELTKEGVLEELPQGVQEQIFTNIATGKPWDQKLGEAAARSLATGAAMGGGHATITKSIQALRDKVAERLATPAEKTATTEQKEPTVQDLASGNLPKTVQEEEADEVEAIAKHLISQNIPKDNAYRIAQNRILQNRKDRITDLIAEPSDDPVHIRAKEYIDNGVDPIEAVNKARIDIAQETEADALAEKEAGGKQDVSTTQPIGVPSGAGASVAGQRGAVPPAEGVGRIEPTGVVSTRPDVTEPTGGEGVPTVALGERDLYGRIEPTLEATPLTPPAQPAPVEEAKEGYVRVYHSGSPSEGETGRWASTNKQYASDYRPDLPLFYVDIPANDPRVNNPDYAEQGVGQGFTFNFELTPEEASQLKEVPSKTASATTETTGEPLGTQAPQTQQAEAQEQETTAESVATTTKAVAEGQKPTGKRGRKPIALTEEERAAKEGQTKATNAANARERRAIERAEAQIAEANIPVDPTQYENAEQIATAQHEKRAQKIQAMRTLFDMAKKHGKSALGNKAKAALADRKRISQQEHDDIKRGWQATQTARSARTAAAASKINPGVTGTMTANQVLTQVTKTGTFFEKKLAGLLRKLVVGVDVVVVEKGDPLPDALKGDSGWDRARAVYVPPAENKGKRAVYLRGASFGNHNGVNNSTILHELLHAGLNRKLWAGMEADFKNLDAPLAKFVGELTKLMVATSTAYDRMQAQGLVPAELEELVERTLVVDPENNQASYEIFDSPHEFLSYSMTEPAMQDFMKGLPSERGNVFSRFARSIMDYLGLKEKDASAFTDLLSVTEDIAGAEMPAAVRGEGERSYQKKTPSASVIPEDEDKYGNANRSAKELAEASLIAQEKTRLSREGTELKGAEALFKARDATKVATVLKALVDRGWINMSRGAIDALVRLPTATFLGTWSGIQAIKDADTQMQAMNGMANSLTAASYKIRAALARELNPFFKSNKEYRTKFENLIYETTITRYDPSDRKQKVRDARLDALYKSVGAKGQKLYGMLRDYYRNLADLYSDLLDQQIENLQGLTAEAKTNLIRTLRTTFETGARITPFFPLVRYGDFWFRVEKGDYKGFYMFESPGERDQFAREVAEELREDVTDKRFFDTGDTVRSLRRSSQANSQMLTQAFDAIDKQDFGDGGVDAKEALKDAIYQIYLNTMPEQSFRKMFIHRKDKTGFSTDVLRNVAATASRMSMQLARLKYAPMLRNSVSAAHDAVKGRSNYSPFVDEIERRVDLALSGNAEQGFGNALAGLANKTSYLWFLSGASSALIQPASVYIASLPVIGANHNDMIGAARELGKMVTLLNQYTMLQDNPDGTTSIVAPSISNNKSLSENERDAVREMFQRGVTQTTYTSLVWGYKNIPTQQATSVVGKTKQLGAEAANLVVGALMHNVERLTREATFLASYRLGYKRFQKEGMSKNEAHEAAINQAVSDVNESLANYDLSNRPRWMQQGVGRVAFQFKMFPVHTALLLTTNFFKMLPFLNKEGKAAAAKKFFGIYLTAGSIAGLVGIPAFSPILGVLAYAMKKMEDDDEGPEDMKDKDPQLWFREVFLPELLGDTHIGDVPVSDILTHGPLNAMTGLAISQRIGLNDLFGRDTKEARTSQEGLTNWIMEHAGPSVSLGMSVARASDLYQQGEFQKAAEAIAPAFARNWIIADRYSKEGITDSKGNVVIPADKAGGYALAQRIGFRPDILARLGETNFKLTAVEQKIENERNLLIVKMKVQARKRTEEGDLKLSKIFEEEVTKFDERNPEKAILPDQAVKAILNDLKTRASARAGHEVT